MRFSRRLPGGKRPRWQFEAHLLDRGCGILSRSEDLAGTVSGGEAESPSDMIVKCQHALTRRPTQQSF